MSSKRKATAAEPARSGPGRRPTSGLDRRKARSISLPESVWALLEYVTSAGIGNLSSLVETYLTTPAHLPKLGNRAGMSQISKSS